MFADANVPMSSALRVAGPQEVLTQLPFDQQALSQYLESLGVSPRSATADRLEQAFRGLSPVVRQQVANRPNQMAEEALRTAIRTAGLGGGYYGNLAGLDRTAPLDQLLTNSDALRVYNEAVVRYGGTPVEAPTNGLDDVLRAMGGPDDARGNAPTALSGATEVGTTGSQGAGYYSVTDRVGNVTIYQLDADGTVKGKLQMYRTDDRYMVGGLSADPGSTSAANLLAAAKLIAEQNMPGVQYPLQPSSNLSQFSRPLVQKLQAAGLVDPSYTLPAVDLMNNIDRPFELGYGVPTPDVPRLTQVPKEPLRATTRQLIGDLAKAKREGRISPDTIESRALLKADLARRMAHANRTGRYQFPYDPRPEQMMALGDSAVASVLGDTGPQLLNELRNSSDETVQALLSVSNTGEMILMPMRQFADSPQDFGEYLSSLITALRERLGRSPDYRASYGYLMPGEEMYADENIYSALWHMWDNYGGPNARAMIDNIPAPE